MNLVKERSGILKEIHRLHAEVEGIDVKMIENIKSIIESHIYKYCEDRYYSINHQEGVITFCFFLSMTPTDPPELLSFYFDLNKALNAVTLNDLYDSEIIRRDGIEKYLQAPTN